MFDTSSASKGVKLGDTGAMPRCGSPANTRRAPTSLCRKQQPPCGLHSPELAGSRLCSACHGPGGYKIGAPALAGQYAAYIERKLAAFAQGIRHNDIYEQTRAIARQLTPDEIKAVAVFYGSQGPELAAKK